MRYELSDKVEAVVSKKDAVNYLTELSAAVPQMSVESPSIEAYISAIAGFLVDFNESEEMNADEFRRICAILFESLFYE